jgi:hypothetical protein
VLAIQRLAIMGLWLRLGLRHGRIIPLRLHRRLLHYSICCWLLLWQRRLIMRYWLLLLLLGSTIQALWLLLWLLGALAIYGLLITLIRHTCLWLLNTRRLLHACLLRITSPWWPRRMLSFVRCHNHN